MRPKDRSGLVLCLGGVVLLVGSVTTRAGDGGPLGCHCPPPLKWCSEQAPCIKFKCACPRPVCDPCNLKHYGYYATCWQPWPFPPDWSHCPSPPPGAVLPPPATPPYAPRVPQQATPQAAPGTDGKTAPRDLPSPEKFDSPQVNAALPPAVQTAAGARPTPTNSPPVFRFVR